MAWRPGAGSIRYVGSTTQARPRPSYTSLYHRDLKISQQSHSQSHSSRRMMVIWLKSTQVNSHGGRGGISSSTPVVPGGHLSPSRPRVFFAREAGGRELRRHVDTCVAQRRAEGPARGPRTAEPQIPMGVTDSTNH